MRIDSQLCKLLPVTIFFFLSQSVFAQTEAGGSEKKSFSISAGLGVGTHAAHSLVDYMNALARPQTRLDEFSPVVEFFLAPELRISEEWNLALEYSLLVKSYALDSGSGFSGSDFSYNIHMPSVLLHYVMSGMGYRLKFGGGVGYHVATFTQTIRAYGVEDNYTSRGVGLKLEAIANTQFDETFYGSIGADLRWGFLGNLKKTDGTVATDRNTNLTPTMQFFSAGIKFGIMIQL